MTGVDLSPEMLAVAKVKDCFDKLAEANLRKPLEFPPLSFDLIMAAGVIFSQATVESEVVASDVKQGRTTLRWC